MFKKIDEYIEKHIKRIIEDKAPKVEETGYFFLS